MHLKHLCLLLSLGNIFTKSLKPTNIVSTIKNLNWDKNSNIVLRKSNKFFKNNDINSLYQYFPSLQNSSLIRLTPGGLRGFYNLGTCVYIKEQYNLDNYMFSGASAGAWNGLLMTYKKNPHDFSIKILDSMRENNKLKTIYDTQLYLKEEILKSYCITDFELEKLFIGVTCINNNNIYTNIYSDFLNLEDAIDCCIASSNIPFITGNCEIKYNDISSLDGGFSIDPYLNKETKIEIGPDMWNKKILSYYENNKYDIYKMFFYNNKNVNFYELYIKGYSDAKYNSEFLNDCFHK
jgi:hypothetical protein